MAEEIHHYYHSKGCSSGIHKWAIKFNRSNKLGWTKVCRRCDKVELSDTDRSENGKWIINRQYD